MKYKVAETCIHMHMNTLFLIPVVGGGGGGGLAANPLSSGSKYPPPPPLLNETLSTFKDTKLSRFT